MSSQANSICSLSTMPVSISSSLKHHEDITEHDKNLQYVVSKIKEKIVRQMKTNDNLEELIIIDALQKFGFNYYYLKEDIHAILKRQYSKYKSWEENGGIDDLYEVALRFRVLRQEGYNVSPDIFKKFKNDEGKFKEELCKDIRGVMSLFEATQLSIQNEDILDEASEFSKNILQASLMNTTTQFNARKIEYTLNTPFYKSFATKILAKSFMFEEFLDDYIHSKDWKDEVLNLASIDFEMTQEYLGKELMQVSQWGEELNSGKKLEFARIRPIKWYMWSLAIIPWPSMIEERIELAKVVSFVYIIDDIFDVHGTLDELSLFTEVINGWEYGAIDQLPEYMKVCVKALYDFTDDFSHKIYQKYKWNPKYSLVKVWIDLCNSFLVEAKWFVSGQLPSAEEYLSNGIISSAVHMVLMHAFFLLGRVNWQSIDEMNNLPCIVSSTATIVRLWNDIGTDQKMNRTGNDGSYIDCLKNENKDKWTTDITREHVSRMISDAWKKLNQEYLSSSSSFSAKFKVECLNFARMGVIMYNHDAEIHRRSLEKHLSLCLANVQMKF